MILWSPNASSAGPTEIEISVSGICQHSRPIYLPYILIRRFHSFFSELSSGLIPPTGAGVGGVGSRQFGGRNFIYVLGMSDNDAVWDWYALYVGWVRSFTRGRDKSSTGGNTFAVGKNEKPNGRRNPDNTQTDDDGALGVSVLGSGRKGFL